MNFCSSDQKNPPICSDTHWSVVSHRTNWSVGVCMLAYKSVCPAAVIFDALVNRHTNTDTQMRLQHILLPDEGIPKF